MALILKYGTYTHDEGEAEVVITQEKTYAETGQQTGYKAKWSIRGVLHGTGVSNVTTKLDALALEYNKNGQNLILYQSDGTTATHHALTSNNTSTGVRITMLKFPVGSGAEYSTFRTYEIEAEAEIIGTNADFDTWTETISIHGGGPRFVFLQTLIGLPQKQLVAQATPYFATQSGSAVGLLAYPRFPAPMFPAHEHVDQRQQSKVSPQVQPNTPTHFQIDWSYEFESASPLFGVPGIP